MPRLTKQLIDETPFPAAGQVFVRDTELAGFGLRVTQGRKSFILEKRIRGRMRRFTLGPYGPLILDQARKLAADSGIQKGSWYKWINQWKVPTICLGRSVRVRDEDYRKRIQKSLRPEIWRLGVYRSDG